MRVRERKNDDKLVVCESTALANTFTPVHNRGKSTRSHTCCQNLSEVNTCTQLIVSKAPTPTRIQDHSLQNKICIYIYCRKIKTQQRSLIHNNRNEINDSATSKDTVRLGSLLVCASKNGSRWSSRIVQTLFGHPPNGPGVHPIAAARENRRQPPRLD